MFSLVSGMFNKVPSFTHFGLKKLRIALGDFIPTRICARYDFNSYSITPNELIFEL